MPERIIKTNDYQFEPVHIDWTGTRTQLIVGLVAIFCLCLSNFFPLWRVNSYGVPIEWFINFIVYFASCAAVSFLTLTIGRTYGNRNGASCAIWAGTIFAAHPIHRVHAIARDDISPQQELVFRLILCVILILTLFLLRQRRKLIVYIGFVILVFCLFLYATYNDPAYSACFGCDYGFHPLDKPMFLPACVLTGLILFWRLVIGNINWRNAAKIGLCLLIAYKFIDSVVAFTIFTGAAAFAIAVSLACLPTLGIASARNNRIYGSFGVIALTLIAIAFEQMLIASCIGSN